MASPAFKSHVFVEAHDLLTYRCKHCGLYARREKDGGWVFYGDGFYIALDNRQNPEKSTFTPACKRS
jgi:hypothetical protein